nr:peptidyl-prolyl cis-trans isomerase FKBP12 [Tanacetum cinerariifolium]
MGIEKELLRAGTGPKPSPGQNVTVHCTGYEKKKDAEYKVEEDEAHGHRGIQRIIDASGDKEMVKRKRKKLLKKALYSLAR